MIFISCKMFAEKRKYKIFCIGLTLLCFKLGGMPLVPTTKMAEAHKYSISGNHWPGEPRDLLKTTSPFEFRPAFFGTDSKTRIFYKHVIFKHCISFSQFLLQCDSLIHQQTSKATKWINHANLLFLKILCL